MIRGLEHAYNCIENINRIEIKLPAEHFFRVHDAHIVSIRKIHTYSDTSLRMDTNEDIPIAPANLQGFKQWIASLNI